jgi:hypothetical protein
MKITASQLRRIIKEEVASVTQAPRKKAPMMPAAKKSQGPSRKHSINVEFELFEKDGYINVDYVGKSGDFTGAGLEEAEHLAKMLSAKVMELIQRFEDDIASGEFEVMPSDYIGRD